jgi:hypothetical protein
MLQVALMKNNVKMWGLRKSAKNEGKEKLQFSQNCTTAIANLIPIIYNEC